LFVDCAPQADGATPLFIASELGFVEIVGLLLVAGAAVDQGMVRSLLAFEKGLGAVGVDRLPTFPTKRKSRAECGRCRASDRWSDASACRESEWARGGYPGSAYSRRSCGPSQGTP
jgi:hypothetical protein